MCRPLLITVPVFLSLLLLVPAISAQEIAFKFEQAHEDMPLPDTGQRIHQINIEAVAKDFVCLRDADFSVEVILGEFEKWAGASMNPRVAVFRVPATTPGNQPKPLDAKSVKLEITWDTEGRPKIGAQQIYEVKFDDTSFKLVTGGGPCAPPDIKPKWGEPIKFTAHMPDIVENVTIQQDCVTAPELPECQITASVAPEGNSPGFDLAVLALAVVGLAIIGRRRLK